MVLNLEPSIAVTQNFISTANFQRSVRHASHGSSHFHQNVPLYFPEAVVLRWGGGWTATSPASEDDGLEEQEHGSKRVKFNITSSSTSVSLRTTSGQRETVDVVSGLPIFTVSLQIPIDGPVHSFDPYKDEDDDGSQEPSTHHGAAGFNRHPFQRDKLLGPWLRKMWEECIDMRSEVQVRKQVTLLFSCNITIFASPPIVGMLGHFPLQTYVAACLELRLGLTWEVSATTATLSGRCVV